MDINMTEIPQFSFPYHTGDISNPVFNLWSFKKKVRNQEED